MIVQQPLLQLSPARSQRGCQHTCPYPVIRRPGKLLLFHSKLEGLPQNQAKQPNKNSCKYPRPHELRGSTPQRQLEGNGTNALMLILVISSKAGKITISSAIKQLVCLTQPREAPINLPHATPTAAGRQSPPEQGESTQFLITVQSR